MVRSKAIQQFGNGALYKDEDTVRGYIAELDPLKKTRKSGRAPQPHYLIDLKLRD